MIENARKRGQFGCLIADAGAGNCSTIAEHRSAWAFEISGFLCNTHTLICVFPFFSLLTLPVTSQANFEGSTGNRTIVDHLSFAQA